ncbi:MAG TPA: hypothetical protein VFU49_04985 [Ktedonobacteraceae bacterium]|nr:hypothetical protein [Ktedonobacteraceae bacterium]
MPDRDLVMPEPANPAESDMAEPGFLHIEETEQKETIAPPVHARLASPPPPQNMERPGTVEHLAAREPVAALDPDTPEIKQRLGALRLEVTSMLTGLRWHGQRVDDIAAKMIPLLNVGAVEQWKPVLIPFLFEIDRAGNLVPVWLKIIERGDPPDLPPDTNPAETMEGRARRFAILMLGNYKSADALPQSKPIGFARPGSTSTSTGAIDLPRTLGKLALDPSTSLYATQALAKQGTTAAIQTLISTLKDAKGWAKVDVVEGILALEQERFNDILIASGLQGAPGLESYLATPLYQGIPLEPYLRGGNQIGPRLSEQAALIFHQVLQNSMIPPIEESDTVPVVFERKLLPIAQALFEGTRSTPTWQHTITMHRLGVMLGRYWSKIASGTLQNTQIVEQVYGCLPMMNEVERWMDGPGRDVLLDTLANSTEQDAVIATTRVLGELRDPRAIGLLITQIEKVQEVPNREQALLLGTKCQTLGFLGDRRAVAPLLHLLHRTVDVAKRNSLPRRTTPLPTGDPDIPGSIVYTAIIRACGQLGDRSALESVSQATKDVDPYVRSRAVEAARLLDPGGEADRTIEM